MSERVMEVLAPKTVLLSYVVSAVGNEFATFCLDTNARSTKNKKTMMQS